MHANMWGESGCCTDAREPHLDTTKSPQITKILSKSFMFAVRIINCSCMLKPVGYMKPVGYKIRLVDGHSFWRST